MNWRTTTGLLALVIASGARCQDCGLHLRFTEATSERHDDRLARTVALWLGPGEPATPFLDAAAFRAEWRGSIEIPARDRYAFTFEGTGRFSLEIDGEVVLDAASSDGAPVTGEAVRIRKGPRALLATYANIEGKPAQVRLSWQSRRFEREPVPPQAFTFAADDPDLAHGLAARRGRMTIATRRCVACHDDPVGGDPLAMPELRMRGPDLGATGRRLEPAWVAAWLREPRALRASARMPRLVDDRQDAVDLAAFLATLTEGPVWQGPGDGNSIAGRRAYAALGCVGCHRFGLEDGVARADLIDLTGAGAKFQPGALAAFLADPQRHDPWIRMPDLELSPREAVDLAAYLRERAVDPNPGAVAEAGSADRGRMRAGELGCAACHAIPGVEPRTDAAPPLAEVLAGSLDAGCLAETPSPGVPDYGLSAAQRAELRSFAGAGTPALLRRTSIEFAARQIEERRCTACHVLDGRTDDWTERAALAARWLPPAVAPAEGDDDGPHVDQARPDLTWAGDKLRVDWLEEFLAGRITERPRPWLHARMPAFPELADGMAQGLAAMHGHPPRAAGASPPDPQLVRIGRKLFGAEGGFACVTCHGLAGEPPLAVFEVQGIDLARSAERLRPGYFARWMANPLRIDPGSRMPRYADDGGRTAFGEVFGGSAREQFGAIWDYLRSIK